MRFRKLVLRNWKNFQNVEVEIPDRMFIVGPNASGKSNFLDAFRFLRDLSSSGGGFQEAVTRRGGVRAIRCLSARRHPDIELLVELQEANDGRIWVYEVAFNQDPQCRPLLKKERVLRQGEVLFCRPDEHDNADPARLTQTFLEQVNVNRDFRDIVTFFASTRYLHIVPQLVRDPARSVGRANDPFGGDFLEQIAKTPEKTLKARLRRIQVALQVAVPQMQEIGLCRDVCGTPHLWGKYKHWCQQDARQTEEQFSDGTLRLIGLLWAVIEGEGLLLLEEPELSLHPEVVCVLPQMLERLQRRTGRQIFLSTHSPSLLLDEGIGLDEVLLLVPGVAGTDAKLASSYQDTRRLLDSGLSMVESVFQKTKPEQVSQLALVGDD
jgi:predicted ATPase